MSLSARIVLRPSRRLTVCEVLLPLGGLGVAGSALAARWPGSLFSVLAGAAAAGLLFALMEAARPRVARAIVLSEHRGIGSMSLGDEPAEADGDWRLVEPTMVWPGFAVVALEGDAGHRWTVPVLDADLPAADRRALHRFLRWSLHGGVARPTVAD